MHDAARDRAELVQYLQRFPGLGPSGADTFCREVQGTWADIAPYVDDRVAEGAQRVGLPKSPDRLAAYVRQDEFPRLTAACVRAAPSRDVVANIRG